MSNPRIIEPAETAVANGTIKEINGQDRVFYDGYWVRHYDVPDTFTYKKQLIDQLTRRVFHHAEPGINTPGERLEEVRSAYEFEQDQSKKRVLAAMLAGALLNRGSDILTRMVELEEIGVTVDADNKLMKECGRCFMGALEYGGYIRPVTTTEGLDELWGEPFKAFTLSIERFLETRYLKIAHTMAAIDDVTHALCTMFDGVRMFTNLLPMVMELGTSAKQASEIMRSDSLYISVWPKFVGAADKLALARPVIPDNATRRQQTMGKRGMALFDGGRELMVSLASMRVPLIKSSQAFEIKCEKFAKTYLKKA